MTFPDIAAWYENLPFRTEFTTSAVLFVSIIIAGLITSLIIRGAITRSTRQRERLERTAATSTLIHAAVDASSWAQLGTQERAIVDRSIGQADTHLRMLALPGAQIAADWSTYQLAVFKRHSISHPNQSDGPLADFRDRLIEWQNKPGRARKIFESDIEGWQLVQPYDSTTRIDWSLANSDQNSQEPLISAVPSPLTFDDQDRDPTPASSSFGHSKQEAVSGASVESRNYETQQIIDDVAALETRMPPRTTDEDKPRPI